MLNFIKSYLLAVVALCLTAALVVGLIWAYDYFVQRELNVEGVRVQEYVSKEGKFTVMYSCDAGVQHVDFEAGAGK